jgi:hypothetical protein
MSKEDCLLMGIDPSIRRPVDMIILPDSFVRPVTNFETDNDDSCNNDNDLIQTNDNLDSIIEMDEGAGPTNVSKNLKRKLEDDVFLPNKKNKI